VQQAGNVAFLVFASIPLSPNTVGSPHAGSEPISAVQGRSEASQDFHDMLTLFRRLYFLFADFTIQIAQDDLSLGRLGNSELWTGDSQGSAFDLSPSHKRPIIALSSHLVVVLLTFVLPLSRRLPDGGDLLMFDKSNF
jgi:hypothetical protein